MCFVGVFPEEENMKKKKIDKKIKIETKPTDNALLVVISLQQVYYWKVVIQPTQRKMREDTDL